MVGDAFTWMLSGLFWIGYLVWGWYTFRARFRDHEELSPTVEVVTLGALVFFFMFELSVMRRYLADDPVWLALAVSGLLLSGLILYGPMVVSLASHLLVDMVIPGDVNNMMEPDYGPGEACELRGDFEGAAAAYMAVSRMYPKDPGAALRTADNLMKLNRFEEAVAYFTQGLESLESADRSLPVVYRLTEVYTRYLHRPEKAVRVLEDYLERFPQAEYADAVRRRIEQLRQRESAQGLGSP